MDYMTVRLVALLGIFVALPVVLYGQFESADGKMRHLVTSGIQHQSWLIAQALKPVLDQGSNQPPVVLNGALAKFAGDGTLLKLLFQPVGGQGKPAFYYVASLPDVGSAKLGAELDAMAQQGILQRLSETCSLDQPVDLRTSDSDQREFMTSIIPIRNRWGCWILVASHPATEFLDTSVARPYWQTPEVRVATLIYLGGGLIGALIGLSVWRTLRHFRNVVREMGQGRIGEATFAARNLIPELVPVAADFDKLVLNLHRIAADLRQAAEDNAHSFKAPVATIQSALQPLRKLVGPEDKRGERAIQLIESSISRLKTLITAAKRLENNAADLIETPVERVNLTRVVGDSLLRFRELAASRGVSLSRMMDEDVPVSAGRGILEVIIENVVDNAISFTPSGGTVMVNLTSIRGEIHLRIEDSGPGIDPDKLDRVFDRYFSFRPGEQTPAREDEQCPAKEHAGLGLWIVRYNVEMLGGTVAAANLPGGGFCVHITLPGPESREASLRDPGPDLCSIPPPAGVQRTDAS